MTTKRRLNKINKTLDEFKQHNAVPPQYQDVLEKRLVIAFQQPSDRQRSQDGPLSAREIRARFEQKMAGKVYSYILEEAPHVFLPFLIVTTPRVCENFKSFEFCRDLKAKQKNELASSVQQFLRDVGNRHNITQNPRYMNLMKTLFPQAPTTEAKGDKSYKFLLASLSGISIWFGSVITTAIEGSPLRSQEIAKNQTDTTECLVTRFPRDSFQDVVISIDVGSADELNRHLFPHTEDHAKPISKGASVSAIQSIFPSQICDAIEKSQLRIWEKTQPRHDSTNCVEMRDMCQISQHRTIQLRIQYFAAVAMVKDVYAALTSS